MVDDRMIVNRPLTPPRKTEQVEQQQTQKPEEGKEKTSFAEILKKRIEDEKELEFSHHAEKRMLSRGIDMTEQDLARLNKAVEKAEDKGARDSLIMVDNVAYLVSIENRTVITAVDDENVEENVFTNIDSAVFM